MGGKGPTFTGNKKNGSKSDKIPLLPVSLKYKRWKAKLDLEMGHSSSTAQLGRFSEEEKGARYTIRTNNHPTTDPRTHSRILKDFYTHIERFLQSIVRAATELQPGT